MGHWFEIRNDYFVGPNEINRGLDGDLFARISIDAWKTPDENESGEVIASVMISQHGDVIVDYRDNVARNDAMAQESIAQAAKDLRDYFVEHQRDALSSAETEPGLPDQGNNKITLDEQIFSAAGKTSFENEIAPPKEPAR